MNRPCLHFAFNEEWILNERTKYDRMSDEELMRPAATEIPSLRDYEEKYPDGKVRIRWSGGVGIDGRFLLHGVETWYYQNGRKQRQVQFDKGRKAGIETYWSEDGKVVWKREHKSDGSCLWTQYWPDGKKKAESRWENFACDGTATVWDRKGSIVIQKEFAYGQIVE